MLPVLYNRVGFENIKEIILYLIRYNIIQHEHTHKYCDFSIKRNHSVCSEHNYAAGRGT